MPLGKAHSGRCVQFEAEQKQREAAQKEGASLAASLDEQRRKVILFCSQLLFDAFPLTLTLALHGTYGSCGAGCVGAWIRGRAGEMCAVLCQARQFPGAR